MVKVEFNTNEYEFSHGKAPRGRGSWAFEIEGMVPIFWMHNYSYAEAKRAAKARAIETAQGKVGQGNYLSVEVKVLP